MNSPQTYVCYLICFLTLVFSGCKKEILVEDEVAITGVKVFNDSIIQMPIDVVAGRGYILSAYYLLNTNGCQFMLTDNKGDLKWIKKFDINQVSALFAEADGSFSIFDNTRLLNIDIEGNVLKDDQNFLAEISNYSISHITTNTNGNYFFYGTTSGTRYAFAFEITKNGDKVFKKLFTANTLFSGCQRTSDGGYLFLGSLFYNNITPTKFFICRMSATGDVLWTKYYYPPGCESLPENNVYYTHDMLESNDGNYFCLVGSSNSNQNNAARIYKVNPDGNLLDSVDINFGKYNFYIGGREQRMQTNGSYNYSIGYSSVKLADGTFQVLLLDKKLIAGIPNTPFASESKTFSVKFNDDLQISYVGYLQNSYNDTYGGVCTTSEGEIAAFGVITSFGKVNKPILLITR